MNSVTANNMLRLPPNLIRLLFIGLLVSSVGLPAAQAQDPMMTSDPPFASDDSEMTPYNSAVLIDVLANDYTMGSQFDISTLTVVNGPMSGTADVDPTLGMILYTPTTNYAGYDEFQYQVSDGAGNVSNIATVSIYVVNMAPSISLDMPYEDLDDLWIFRGTVHDENPSTCKVTFGGLLEGKTAYVNSDGEFCLEVLLENGEEGPLSAQATDEVGDVSNIEEEIIFRY